MSGATFHAPRRKRKVYESYESPFPIPLSHDGSTGKDFRICQAEIVNNYVIVRRVEDIELLYGKGYFGKGVLSRSRPQYNIGDQQLFAKWRAAKMNLPVISSKKYQRHTEWAKNLLEEQGLDAASVTRILEDYTRPTDLPSEEKDPEGNLRGESRTGLEPESVDSTDSTATSNPESEEKASLEGNPDHDPLAKYPSDALDTQEMAEELDRVALEKTHCHRHDDLILHCGCKPEKQTVGNTSGSVVSGEQDLEYVLVEEEESVGMEVEDNKEDKGEIRREKLVCRRNPFKIFEYLQLSREEAFFLVYAMGCLTITYHKEPLTILKLWEVFSSVQPTFQSTYMAYHHFRSKGWVPKVGLKYGTDLLLYRKGPPFYHASYSVIVEFVSDDFEGVPLRPLTWKSLAGLNRTTVNVSKELLFCYLIKPPHFTERDLKTPECIHKIQIQELIVSRWISSRERMEQDEL
ncbi:tRNA-splicing endonuclease subunit Sen2 [Rhinophrynus dorsalis]